MRSARLPEEFADFVNYIITTYSGASKIVEIGVGRFCSIAAEIKYLLPNAEVIVTDSDVAAVNEANRNYPSLKVVKDDVENPNIKLYKNAEIIYSIRAPTELWPKIVQLSELIHSDLIICPLPTETPVTIRGFRLVNSGRARFYLKGRYATSQRV